ncbi:MAG: DUF1624 domain-containing protein [Gammaproteobacteria bacterium]|nr:DUF1624 domain-containing protein [Gammaproteobacteria bacterium]
MNRENSCRYPLVDLARGVAILMMIVYHFFYDLSYFSFLVLDFYQGAFWIGFRYLILGLFISLVGVSLVLARENGVSGKQFLIRVGWIVFYAALISLVSWLLFGSRIIFFGVLHFIALASLLGALFTRLYWINLILGLLLVLIGTGIESTLFNHSWLQWLGLMTYKPLTEDYVPFLPWFGIVLWGMFLARMVLNASILPLRSPTWPGANILIFAGRHSLIIYMLHQVVLFGVLWCIRALL